MFGQIQELVGKIGIAFVEVPKEHPKLYLRVLRLFIG